MIFSRRRKYNSLSDEDILQDFKEGQSMMAITELYSRYAHLVLGVSMKYLKNKFDAEDITMNIFEVLPSKLLSHEIKNFKAWLYIVTKNECFMLLRKKGIETTELIPEITAQNEEEGNLEIQLQILESEIEVLNDIQKLCIRLFYIERKSYAQIVQITQIELKQVKSAIQNGKRNLKLKLIETDEFKTRK